MDWINIISVIITPLTGLVAFIAGRKKTKNDFLQELQTSIDILAADNKRLYIELMDLRKELYERDKQIYELKKQALK